VDHFSGAAKLPPAITTASTMALECLLAESERVTALQANGRLFVDMAKAAGLEVGRSAGYSVVPIMVGSSAMAARLSTELGKQGLNVQSITCPAVEEGEARLRFFVTSAHTPDQIRHAIGLVAETLAKLKATFGDE
jgi:8-amino-7-oxononanoate synthase